MRVTRPSDLVIAGLMAASVSGRADPVPLDLQHRHPAGLTRACPGSTSSPVSGRSTPCQPST
ncbi:hypothetical protein [Marinivivus vitaminiproducens]|uniref:hypothetical protein n=1 Tax=Marinivivus vitaminiproducens TaxID=3035935 RepID=UPI0027A05A28|nr:hypothetical protein P4R82_23430 [Geminicoccaceae bacterium SCSIO 64248]